MATYTKAEIKRKIDQLNYEKYSYADKRDQYRKSLNYANKLLSSLNSGSKYLISSEDNLKKYFTINSKTVDGGKIVTAKENLNNIIRRLKNTIIPRINSEISELNNRINNLDYQINNLWRQYNAAQS